MATPRPDIFKKYLELEQPNDQVFCTYVFVDASMETLRSKMLVLNYEPVSPTECPEASFCGKGTHQWRDAGEDSELCLVPVALFRDPFLLGRNKLVLCEVLNADRKPNENNTRHSCLKTMEEAKDQEPWFGIEQEYVLFGRDGIPLGWTAKDQELEPLKTYFYAVGTGNTAGRQVADAHIKACSYAGVKLYGSNAEAVLSQWEYQIGPLPGVEAGDHLWISRYILQRVTEDFDVVVSFDPRPYQDKRIPGSAGHVNFSTKASRAEGGLEWIINALEKLKVKNDHHLTVYDPRSSQPNQERLNSGTLTTPTRDFVAGFSSKLVCVRVPRITVERGRGYFEDRRPGANVEPYRAMQALVETLCLAS